LGGAAGLAWTFQTYFEHPSAARSCAVVQARDGLSREAPGLATIQQHRKNTAKVYLPFEPLRHIASTEEIAT